MPQTEAQLAQLYARQRVNEALAQLQKIEDRTADDTTPINTSAVMLPTVNRKTVLKAARLLRDVREMLS